MRSSLQVGSVFPEVFTDRFIFPLRILTFGRGAEISGRSGKYEHLTSTCSDKTVFYRDKFHIL